jgi:glycosyltransferase involved in cell wall biosynthesis
VVCGLPSSKVEEWKGYVGDARRGTFLPLPFVDEAAMPGLYAHSLAVLYPTLYEGFGFPALEAQSVGRPILMSALGSLRELVGPGAIVLPPHDKDAWIDACRRVVSSPAHVDAEARAWARTFSWKAVADAFLSAYRTAAARDVA